MIRNRRIISFKFLKMNNKNKALNFINQIQKIRSQNNSNWMDILRLSYKHDPKKASKIMSQIYIDDQNIL